MAIAGGWAGLVLDAGRDRACPGDEFFLGSASRLVSGLVQGSKERRRGPSDETQLCLRVQGAGMVGYDDLFKVIVRGKEGYEC